MTRDLPLTTFVVNGKRKTNLLETKFKNNVGTTKKEKIRNEATINLLMTQKSTINLLDDQKARLKTKTTTSNLPTTTTTTTINLPMTMSNSLEAARSDYKGEKQFCLLVKIIVKKQQSTLATRKNKKQQSMMYCFLLCKRSDDLCTWWATSINATNVTWQTSVDVEIHVNLSKKKKNSKNFVSEHLEKKKLWAKWKRVGRCMETPSEKRKQLC